MFIGIFLCNGFISPRWPPVVRDTLEEVEAYLEETVVEADEFDAEDDRLLVFEVNDDGSNQVVEFTEVSADGFTGGYGWTQ